MVQQLLVDHRNSGDGANLHQSKGGSGGGGQGVSSSDLKLREVGLCSELIESSNVCKRTSHLGPIHFTIHGEGRLTNSDLFRTYQPILIEFTMVVYEKIYLAA